MARAGIFFVFNGLFEFTHLVETILILAHFSLDFPNLFTEIIIPLGFAHTHFYLGVDLHLQFGQFDFPVENLQHLVHSVGERLQFQNFLFFIAFKRQMGTDDI